jgi:hypothetical protein
LLVLACTLTSDDFTPTEIEALAPDAALAPAPSPPPPPMTEIVTEPDAPPDAGSNACTSSSELPGCTLVQEAPPECVTNSDCASLHCQNGDCIAASCDDGIANQGESAADCAGPCPARCAEGQACTSTGDCATGLFCPEQRRQCTQISCSDDARNGDEVGTDCGGSCPPCPLGTACGANQDCATGVCRAGACVAQSCTDGILNQDESAADCGGSCPDCAAGRSCRVAADCDSGVCDGRGCGGGNARCCQPPRCNDDVRNGTEPQTDCGNAQCGACPLGNPCNRNAECGSGLCQNGVCRLPPCQDRQRNGLETDIDCGGTDPACARCALGQLCLVPGDCGAGTCVGGRCAACGNGVRDGNETGIDCGGVCGPCGPGQGCNLDSECQSGICQDERCCGGNQLDCTRCARRLSPFLLCSSDANAAPVCDAFLQCLQDNPDACPTRLTPGCSDVGNVCDPASLGGDGTGGITLADRIIGSAGCSF